MSDPAPAAPSPRKPYFLRRRSIPVPTWRLWLLLLLTLGAAGWLTVPRIHGWLAVTEPVNGARYVAIEGWAPDYVIQAGADWAEDHETNLVFTTGHPLDKGGFFSEFGTFAELSAATLQKLGYDEKKIRAAPAVTVRTSRSRAMAQALKLKLDAENIPQADRKINIVTLGTHARRTRRIFREALGSDWEVGVISVPSRNYAAAQWFRHSDGAKTVIDELVALTVQSSGGD